MRIHYIYIWTIACVLLIVGCSKSDYRSALPANPMALMAVDVGKTNGIGGQTLLKTLLMLGKVDDGGVDLTRKVYLFETADGNLGLCACVRDADHLVETVKKLANKGRGKGIETFGESSVSILDDAWVVAFSGEALLIVGPIPPTGHRQMQERLVRYLSQDVERSGMASPMFQKLDSINTPMAIVAQLQALPEQLVTPFMLGAPRNAEPSQVLIAAGMTRKKNCLLVQGQTFSFNKKIDAALQESAKVFRPITGHYLSALSGDAAMGVFLNVDGNQFLPLMQQNAGLKALLAGINTAIDMNQIVKSIDGDMAFVISRSSNGHSNVSMAAELSHYQRVKDIDYWKESCSQGSSITSWGADGYCYQNGEQTFYFGVKETPARAKEASLLQFYSGTTSEWARASTMPATHPYPLDVLQPLVGTQMGVILNLANLVSDDGLFAQAMPVLNILLGNVSTIVYTMNH